MTSRSVLRRGLFVLAILGSRNILSLRTVSAESFNIVHSQCLPVVLSSFEAKTGLSATSCRVNEVRPLGKISNRSYSFALYRLLAEDSPEDLSLDKNSETKNAAAPLINTAVVILEQHEEELLPIFQAFGEGQIGADWFEEPKLLHVADNDVLYLPHRFSGTGAVNEDQYLLLRNGRWNEIDTESWRDELNKRLPAGTGIWKGVELDLQKMRAESALWKDGDANCCPSGGKVQIDFALRDLRLEIEDVRFPHEVIQ